MTSQSLLFGKNQPRRFDSKMEQVEFELRSFEIPKEGTAPVRRRNKRLTNKKLGLGYDIPGTYTWVEICRDILKDGTNPRTLSRVAKGELKSTNGWEVEVL